MYIIHSYLTYLAVSMALTIWVAQTLQKNGRAFLLEAFRGNAELADSVNRLLVVGFYLINAGYVAVALETRAPVDTVRQAIELVSGKIGSILMVLGVMHFLNLYIFQRLRRRGQEQFFPPPLPPDMHLAGSR